MSGFYSKLVSSYLRQLISSAACRCAGYEENSCFKSCTENVQGGLYSAADYSRESGSVVGSASVQLEFQLSTDRANQFEDALYTNKRSEALTCKSFSLFFCSGGAHGRRDERLIGSRLAYMGYLAGVGEIRDAYLAPK